MFSRQWQSTSTATPSPPAASHTPEIRSNPAWKAPSSSAGSPSPTPSKGASLTWRKPSAAARRADAAKPSGERSTVPRLMLAYDRHAVANRAAQQVGDRGRRAACPGHPTAPVRWRWRRPAAAGRHACRAGARRSRSGLPARPPIGRRRPARRIAARSPRRRPRPSPIPRTPSDPVTSMKVHRVFGLMRTIRHATSAMVISVVMPRFLPRSPRVAAAATRARTTRTA